MGYKSTHGPHKRDVTHILSKVKCFFIEILSFSQVTETISFFPLRIVILRMLGNRGDVRQYFELGLSDLWQDLPKFSLSSPPPSLSPPASQKDRIEMKCVLSGDRKRRPCFKGQGYPKTEKKKKKKWSIKFFVCCVHQWHMYTRASIMSNLR